MSRKVKCVIVTILHFRERPMLCENYIFSKIVKIFTT
jgi:hypothetical protein